MAKQKPKLVAAAVVAKLVVGDIHSTSTQNRKRRRKTKNARKKTDGWSKSKLEENKNKLENDFKRNSPSLLENCGEASELVTSIVNETATLQEAHVANPNFSVIGLR